MTNIPLLTTILPIITFIVGFIVKTFLDFHLGMAIVKHCSWIPTRWLFRHNTTNLAGRWEYSWEPAGSKNYTDPQDRHDHPIIKQFGKYIYAEFIAQKKQYRLFGQILNGYVVGEWSDCNDPEGYFGAFQLRIVNSNCLEGIWVGHSKTSVNIRSDELKWEKINKN